MATYTGITSLTFGEDTLELASSSTDVNELREQLEQETTDREEADAELRSAIDSIPEYSLSTGITIEDTTATINITLTSET